MIEKIKYIWTQEIILSGTPTEAMKYNLLEHKDEVDESVVCRLDNGNFAFLRFKGNKKDPSRSAYIIKEGTFEELSVIFEEINNE